MLRLRRIIKVSDASKRNARCNAKDLYTKYNEKVRRKKNAERCRCKKCREQREIIKQVAKVYAMNYAGKLCHDILYKDVEEGKYDTE